MTEIREILQGPHTSYLGLKLQMPFLCKINVPPDAQVSGNVDDQRELHVTFLTTHPSKGRREVSIRVLRLERFIQCDTKSEKGIAH